MATKTTIKSYTTNLAKSLGYITFDALLKDTPLHETITENKDTVKDLYQGIKDFAKSPKDALKNSQLMAEYSPILKDGFNNLIEDIKSGTLYNKSREEAAMMSSIAGDDFDFDFDFDDFGESSSTKEESVSDSSTMAAKAQSIATGQNIKAMDIVGKTTAKAINTTTARSAQYIVQAQQASTALIMKQQAKMFNQVSIGLAGVNQNLGALVSLGEPLTAHMQNSIKFYTETSQKLDKMVNLLESVNKSLQPVQQSGSNKSYKGLDSYLTSGGAISLSGMKQMLSRNLGKQIDASPLGLLLNFQVGSDGKDMWRAMAANPLGTVLSLALPSLLPKSFKDSIEHLGKSIAGFNVALIKKLGSMKGNPVKDFIAGLFGYDDTLNTRIDTSKYAKGKVDFDGKTRKAIIEVIPTYLSKILAALTGGFETRYDYDKGRFVNRQQIMQEKRNIIEDAAREIGYEFADTSDIKNAFRKGDKDITDAEARKIQDDLEKYFANAIKTNMFIDPNKKYTSAEAKKMGFKDLNHLKNVQKVYKHYMRTNNWYRIEELNFNVNRQRLAISERMANASGDDILVNTDNGSFEDLIFGGMRLASGGGNYAQMMAYAQALNNNYTKHSKNSKVKLSESEFKSKLSKAKSNNKKIDEAEWKKRYNALFGKGSFASDRDRMEFIEMLDEESGGGFHFDEDKTTGITGVRNKVRKVIESPLSLVTDILNKADKKLFEIIYGKTDANGNVKEDTRNESVLGLMFVQMKDMFTTFKNWMKEHIFDPVKNWFESKGGFKGMISSIFGIDIDALWDVTKTKFNHIAYNVGQNFKSVGSWSIGKLRGLKDEFGSGSMISARRYYGGASSTDGTKNPSPELLKTAFSMINSGKSIAETARELGINYNTLQRKNQKENPRYAINKKIKNLGKRSKEIIDDKNGLVYQTGETLWNGTMNFLNRIMPDDVEVNKTADKAKEVVKTSLKSLGVDPSGAITGALMGGGLSILSGGLISPMLAASIGGAAGLVIKSEAMQKMLFGDEFDEEGIRIGGMLSKRMTKFLTKDLPEVGGFTVAGGLAGLLPIMPGGPIGGMFIGSALGFAKNSKTVQNFLFGDEKEGTVGLLGSQEDKKAKIEWVKKMLPKAAAGAILGAVAGPFGFVGNVLGGAALGFASDTELFKRAMFGEEKEIGKDSEGNPIMGRDGGIAGLIKKEIVSPLGRAISPIAIELKHNAKSIIHNTGRMIAWAFSKTFASVSRPLWDKLGTFVLGPMAKVLGTTFKGVAKIATSPFKLIGAYGDHLRNKQVRGGYATYMSAKKRHEMTLQKGWAPSGFTDADASMMTMGSEDLSATLGDINSLLNVTNRHTAQNNYNKAAVAVGNIVRRLAPGRKGYALAKKAQNMAAAGKDAQSIISYIQGQGVDVPENVISAISTAVDAVSTAGGNLESSNAARAEAEARLRRIYNLGEDFKLNDRNLMRLQDATSHEISLRNAKGEGHVGAVQKSVQETLKEVADAHTDRIERRIVDVINTIRSFSGLDPLDGGSDDTREIAETITAEDRNNGSASNINGFGGVMENRNVFQAIHSMWNPLHDMDVPSTEAAIQYYEYVTLGKGTVSDIRYSLEECGVSSYDQLGSRVRQIGGNENLISVTDKNFRNVNLHKIGNVWYYAAAHNLLELAKENRVGKAVIGGIKTAVKIVSGLYSTIRHMINPLYQFDPTFAQRALENYDKFLAGESYDDSYMQYVNPDYTNFPNGDVIRLHDDEGHTVMLRKDGSRWVWASSAWLSIHRGMHRIGNLITTGIRSIRNAGKTIGKIAKAIRRKINPFYDFTAEEMSVINEDLKMISENGGGSGEYLREVEGCQGIYRVVVPNKPTFHVDLRSGKPKYISNYAVKMYKTRSAVFGIGGAIKNLFKGAVSAIKGSGSGLVPAARYYRGSGKVWDGIKNVGGKVIGFFGKKGSSGDGDDQSFIDKILSPSDPDSGGLLGTALDKINSSKFNPKNFLSGSTDYALNTKEAREAYRREQGNLNIFRETTFVAQQISKKMDVLMSGLMGISAGGSKKGGGKGGMLGSILSTTGIISAALMAGTAALYSGKLDKYTEGWGGSADNDNKDMYSGAATNLTIYDPETGEYVSAATDKNGRPIMALTEDGELGYQTTNGKVVPATLEDGTSNTPESNGVHGTARKVRNKTIANTLFGRKTYGSITSDFVAKHSGSKTLTSINQTVQQHLYGTKGWIYKVGDVDSIAKYTNESLNFTYDRFKAVYKKDAQKKWAEFQEKGMEQFLKDNPKTASKNRNYLFKYWDPDNMDPKLIEKFNTKHGVDIDKVALREAAEAGGEKVAKEAAEGTVEAAEKEAVKSATSNVVEEAGTKAVKEAAEGTVEAAEKDVIKGATNVLEEAGSQAVKGAAGELPVDTAIKNATQNAVTAAASKGSKELLENEVGLEVKNAMSSLTTEAMSNSVSKAYIQETLGPKRFGDLMEECTEHMAKELPDRIAKEGGENALSIALKKVPFIGWVYAAISAIYQFEEGWYHAAITFHVLNPTWWMKLISAICPCILEILGAFSAADLIPIDWLIQLLTDLLYNFGWVTDDYKKAREEADAAWSKWNQDRDTKGLNFNSRTGKNEWQSFEKFVTLPESQGGLGQTSIGDKVGAAWENEMNRQYEEKVLIELEHAEYLNKLYNKQITKEEYKTKKFANGWEDPGDMGESSWGWTGGLNYLKGTPEYEGLLEQKYPNYKDFWFAYNPMANPEFYDADGSYIGPDPNSIGKGSGLLRGKGGFVSQINPMLSNMKFGGATFGQNGCAPAVASMLTGMPVGTTAGYALNGGYTNNGGTSADYFGNLFAQNGISSEYVFTGAGSAQDYLESRIASGHPTVLLGQDYSNTSKAYSPFGPGNHYVLATGEDSRGNLIIQDPEASRPNITYDRSILNSVKLGIPTGGSSRIRNFARRVGNRVKKALSFRGGASFTIGENHKQIWTFLKKNGLSDAGAAGLMGCWQAESNNRPDRIEGDYVKSFPGFANVASSSEALDQWTQKLFSMYANKGLKINQSAYMASDGHYYPGFGLAQWTGGRGYNLLSWCRQKDYDWKQLLSQLEFALYELQGSYSGVYSGLKNAADVIEACRLAYNKYEGGKRQDWLEARQNYAITIYNELSGKTYSMPTSTGSAADNVYGTATGVASATSGTTGSESGSTGGVQTLASKFNDLFAASLGKLGEFFGIVHSSKNGTKANYNSETGQYGDYGPSGNIINPDRTISKTLKPLPVMNSSHAVNFVNAALSQTGYVETPDNITDFGAFTGAQGAPWCASFVSWAMNKAFKGSADRAAKAMYGGPTASVSNLWDRFRQNDAMSSTPAVGDIVIYKNGTSHTGIVAGVNGNNIETVEGNTSGDSSFSRNGGMVWTKNYDYTKKSNLTGFGRPNWGAVSEDLMQKGYSDSITSGSLGSNFEAGLAAARARAGINVEPTGTLSTTDPRYAAPTGTLPTTDPRYQASGSGLVSYNVAQAGYNTINRKHKRARSVFGGGSGVINLSKLSASSKNRYISALQQYAGSGSVDNETMITLVKGIISLLSNVSANSDQIKEVVKYMQLQSQATGTNNVDLNVSTMANDMGVSDTDSTIREMQQLLQTLAAGA